MLNPAGARNRSPFTATQWQELEHQALIFKYMVSGVPVPPELLYSVKRSLESSLASRLFPHHPIGWGYFQVGFGRKTDPEPGRCRRTDGKKWRCSKEAYPDSKYCERHMHRGRNRSRKPVELTSTTPTTTASPVTNPSLSISRNLSNTTSPSSSSYSYSPLSSSIEPEIHAHQNPTYNTLPNSFIYPPSSSSRPPVSSFSSQNTTTYNLFLDSGSSSHAHDKDYRYLHGMRDGADERAFFPGASGSVRSLQDSYHQQLTMSSYKDYSQTQFQSFSDPSKQQEQHQHCFVLGSDFKSSVTRTIRLDKESEAQKPLHNLFGDQWPPKETESWLDLASNSRQQTDS